MTTTETGIVEKVARASDLHIVFDGPPGNESGRFVECETPGGKSINAGEWHERADGLWELRISRAAIAAMPDSTQLLQTMAGALEEERDILKRLVRQYVDPFDVMPADHPLVVAIGTDADDAYRSALAQFRAQEQRS